MGSIRTRLGTYHSDGTAKTAHWSWFSCALNARQACHGQGGKGRLANASSGMEKPHVSSIATIMGDLGRCCSG